MKNQFTARNVKLTFAFMFVLMASSCSDDNDAMDAAVLAKETNEIAAKIAKVIVANAPDPIIGLFTYSSTTVCLDDDLTVTFDNLHGDDSDCGETKIFYTLNGADWIQLAKGTPTDGKLSVTFEPVAGTYSFRADFNGNEGGCDEGFDNLKSQYNTSLTAVVVAPCEEDVCAYSHGYFKNNFDEWEVTSLMLGSLTYDDSELLAILAASSSGGNSYIILGRQLITIKLNALRGVDVSSIQTYIDSADSLIGNADLLSGPVKNTGMNDLGGIFDAFIKANHCDDDVNVDEE